MMWTASPERHQVPRRDRCRSRIGKPSMRTFIRIGIDLAKNFFQVHAIEREGEPAVTRKLSRGKVLAFFAQAAPCRVGMEACGSSHYWAREIQALGHEVVLIPPAYTKPYVKRGKNDANDAAAICEAMSRPDMRFVPIKSADQQAVLMLHRPGNCWRPGWPTSPSPKRPSKPRRCWPRTAAASTKGSTIWRRRSPEQAARTRQASCWTRSPPSAD